MSAVVDEEQSTGCGICDETCPEALALTSVRLAR